MEVISVKLLIYVVNSLVMGFGILPILSSVLVCWKQKKNAKASRPFHSKQRTTDNGQRIVPYVYLYILTAQNIQCVGAAHKFMKRTFIY